MQHVITYIIGVYIVHDNMYLYFYLMQDDPTDFVTCIEDPNTIFEAHL